MVTAVEINSLEQVIERYEPVIGMETHVELATETKMFCGCPTVFGAEANTHVCPVCLGLPGSLPVANRTAIESTIKIGLALNCTIATWCRFARKNYFYPDMPKNYQISQYDEPLCTNGWLDVEIDGRIVRVEIERVHLEEDTGKITHIGGHTGRIHGASHSLIDFNRAGIPLVEIVTKPIAGTGIDAPAIARAYVTELRDLLRTLDVSDVRMEQGSMRCDVNTSLSARGSGVWGTRTETKNVNSTRSVERAVRTEMLRQAQALDRGERIIQETRHFHEDTGTTTSGRSKEEATDYRYFQDPDLAPIAPDSAWVSELKAQLPETPLARRQRLAAEWGFSPEEMSAVVNADALDLISATIAVPDFPTSAVDARKWWLGELSRRANESDIAVRDLSITPKQVAQLCSLISSGKLNDKLARQAVDGVLAGEGDPQQVMLSRGLVVVDDTDALGVEVDRVIADNPEVVAKIQAGKLPAVGALVGAVMKNTRGKADANTVRELILSRLGVSV